MHLPKLTIFNLVCISHLQHISIPTSNISGAQEPYAGWWYHNEESSSRARCMCLIIFTSESSTSICKQCQTLANHSQ